MREHRCFTLQFRLNENLGYNRDLSSGIAQTISGAKYLATKKGALAAPSYDVIGFFKTRPDLDRPDAQVLMAPWTAAPVVPGKALGLERRARPAVHRVHQPARQRRLRADHVVGSRRATRHHHQLLHEPARPRGRHRHLPEDARDVRGRADRQAARSRDAPGPAVEDDDASSTPGSSTATAATTPSARARWAPPTPTSSTRSSASGASTTCA